MIFDNGQPSPILGPLVERLRHIDPYPTDLLDGPLNFQAEACLTPNATDALLSAGTASGPALS